MVVVSGEIKSLAMKSSQKEMKKVVKAKKEKVMAKIGQRKVVIS